MGRAIGQLEKEVSFKLGRICYIELYGRTVCQFEKEVSFKLGTG